MQFTIENLSEKYTVKRLGKQLGMNFNKMDPAEVQFFAIIIEKYSSVYRKLNSRQGRGKKKRTLSA